MPSKAIFIPGNVPSSKNGRVNTENGSFANATVSRYKQAIGVQEYSSRRKTYKGYKDKRRPNLFESLKSSFIELKTEDKPLLIGVHFVRSSKRKYDHHNIVQIIADLMSAHDWIDDDDTTNALFLPMLIDGNWESVDTKNPGCWVSVFSLDELKDGLTLKL